MNKNIINVTNLARIQLGNIMNITSHLTSLANDTPDAPAIITDKGSLSFLELERALHWTVSAFKSAGVAPGDIVGIDLPDQTQHLLSSLALARLGAGQLAFRPTDPPQLQARISDSLKISAVVAGAGAKSDLTIIEPPPTRLGELKQLNSRPLKRPRTARCHF